MQTNKQIFKLLLIAITTLFFTEAHLAFSDEGMNSVKQKIRQVKESIRTYELDNGLKVILYKRGIAPVFSAVLSTHVGGVDEAEGKRGIAHLLEHMAFKGTKTLGTTDYPKEKVLMDQEEELVKKVLDKTITREELVQLEKVRIEAEKLRIPQPIDTAFDLHGSVDMNATTDKELTTYFVSLPLTAFDFWCWLEAERIKNPVFRQFYSERDVVLEEKRMRFDDSADGTLYENILQAAYTTHPYRNPIIGYTNDLLAATATDIKAFHDKYYTPSNMVISIVGDIDYDREIATINKYFGNLPKKSKPEKNVPVEPQQLEEKKVLVKWDSSPNMIIAYHKPSYPDPADIPITFMYEILAGNKQSLLYKELIDNKKLATSVTVGEFPGYDYPNMLGFFITPAPGVSNEIILKEFDALLLKYKRDGATQEQFNIVKKDITSDYISSFESNLGMAKILVVSELIYDDWTKQFEWLNEIDKVTLDDIKEAANTYLIDTNRVVGTIERK